MADAVSNAFEIERRAIMWTPLITLNDGVTALGWDADPNTVVDGNTAGESWLYSLPVGQFYKQSDATLWWKSGSPNTWISLTNELHTHSNKSTLDLFDEDSSGLIWNGEPIQGGGGTSNSYFPSGW